MGVRFPTAGISNVTGVTIVTTNETIILTTQPLNLTLDFAQVLLFWYMRLTPGTGATAATVNVRRGAVLGGTLVNQGLSVTVTAGNPLPLSGCFVDVPGAVAGQQYSVSVAMAGATANSTVGESGFIALAL